jgi:hypothetical protein
LQLEEQLGQLWIQHAVSHHVWSCYLPLSSAHHTTKDFTLTDQFRTNFTSTIEEKMVSIKTVWRMREIWAWECSLNNHTVLINSNFDLIFLLHYWNDGILYNRMQWQLDKASITHTNELCDTDGNSLPQPGLDFYICTQSET